MNKNMKNFLKFIFENDLENIKIKAYKFAENYKPDVIITANGISKYISIKHGDSNSVHQEHIFSFCNFLKTEGISETIISNIIKFQFNDGTLDGSGKSRKDAQNFLEMNQIEIQKINSELNKPNIIEKITNRLLFKSEYYNIQEAQYIYYGNHENGLWAKKDEIINFMKNAKKISTSIHISKLYYQSLHRNLKFDKYYEYRRYYCQFKWYSLKEDLLYITKKRQ